MGPQPVGMQGRLSEAGVKTAKLSTLGVIAAEVAVPLSDRHCWAEAPKERPTIRLKRTDNFRIISFSINAQK